MHLRDELVELFVETLSASMDADAAVHVSNGFALADALLDGYTVAAKTTESA